MFGIRSETTPAYHPEANGMVEHWHGTLKNSISHDSQSDKNWANRLSMILLGLRANHTWTPFSFKSNCRK